MLNTQKKIGVITIVFILILSLSAVSYFWYKNQSTDTVQVEEPSSPIFLTLKPFTVSLPAMKNGYEVSRVLYVGMVLRLKNDEQKQVLTEYLPEVRSDLLLLLASQDIEKLNIESGKLDLKEQVRASLSKNYNERLSVNIDDVLFTDFIIR